MKNTTLKTLFLLTITLFITSAYAQTDRKSYTSTEVGKVLEKVQSAENLTLREPANLLTKEESQILRDYYITSEISNSTFRATGDVYALDVRNGGDYGTFPLTGPFNIASITTIPNDIYASDFDVTGTLYALETTNANLLTVDPDTGTVTVVAALTGAATGLTYSGLSWNKINSTMYALTTDGTTTNLYTLDLATGSMTLIGATGTTLGIWLAIDNTGIIYMADIGNDNLYTLSPTTGAATLVGPLGVDISFAQDADVDPVSNTLYMAGYIGGGVNNIYSVNVTTGTATALGSVNSNAAELGMFSIDGPIGIDNNFVCDDAITIGLGIINSNGPSNTAGGASNVCLSGATNAEWYKYTATNSGDLTISSDLASNTGVDTRVSVYNDDCNSLACIDSDDNSGANNTSTVVIPVVSGTTYLIEWDDANNADAFDFELSLAISCPDPVNFSVASFTDTSADFSWDAVVGATNGYVLSVFNAGDDPDVDTPVYTENIPSGTLTATATPLMAQTMYDAYLTADCDTDGMSNSVSVSFETDIAPPVCGGMFSDLGGNTGPYLPNENTVTTITPDVSGDVVTVTFTYVDIETSSGSGNQDGCWDYLTVYNGPDTSYPVLAQTLCGEESGDGGVPSVPGSLLSIGMSFTSTDVSGALTFVFTSDGSVQETGWLADVTCGPPPMCVTPGSFTNASNTDTTATYTWDAITNASNGYIFSVFNDGDDPNTATAVYTENVAFGTNTATATGLMPATAYDAYIVADCDADGISSMGMDSFTTEAAPPVCGGSFVDSGGVSGDYSPNESTTTTITPDVAGEYVTVTFTYVDIEANAFGAGNQDGCWDFLTIYDGPDASSPVLAQTLCGEESGDGSIPSVATSLLSTGDSFTSSHTSGALTFVFTSDGSVSETGWIANVTCGALSIDDYQADQFNYYPNPTTGLLHINAKQQIETIEVINMLGQQVMSLNPNALEVTLDFSNLNQGAYFLRSSINGNLTTHKIIKR
ncbi:T9SS type A sorting domain-containing protein [Xanthomarina sp. F2636L]|uniref:T9SS type A sorting domain-containing protein n=1 Tax=Xanthomarina sp. F2636L TaxID=2996018 RepID=UPI00225E6767|nr:T9SS type A sorting domain-containing protein [Xanthomarina sp. F2636L]MCX7549717.1 T9SS type A sorting domain-containing protein [Xanthomarina sp. F2636L]